MTAKAFQRFNSLFEASRAGMPWRRDGEVAPTVVLPPDRPDHLSDWRRMTAVRVPLDGVTINGIIAKAMAKLLKEKALMTPTPAQIQLLKRALVAAFNELSVGIVLAWADFTPEETAELMAIFPTAVPPYVDPVDPIKLPTTPEES